MVCPGGQGDVSVYKNLLFMSVEMPNGRLDCGTQGFPPEPPPAPGHEKEASPTRRASRNVFAASASSTFRTSRTPSKLLRYRPAAVRIRTRWWWIPTIRTTFISTFPVHRSCVRPKNWPDVPARSPDKDPNTALFRIDVIKVPVAAPQDAKIVSSPRVFIDPRTGALNGLNNGGTHDKERETSRRTPISATTSRYIRRSGSRLARAPATGFCWTSKIQFIPSAWTP